MRILVAVLWGLPWLCATPCEAVLAEVDAVRELLEQGQEAEARTRYKRLAKSARPCATDLRCGNAVADLGIRLRFNKEALTFARAVAESSAREYGPRSIQHAVSLETLVQALAMSGKEPEAEPHLRTAMAIADEHGGQDSVFKAGLWNLLGTLHARLQDPEGAQRQFERAWALIRNRPREQLYAVVLHNLAANEMRLGRDAEAQARIAELKPALDRLPRSLQRELRLYSPLQAPPK